MFVVFSVLILPVGVLAIFTTPMDIVPSINILAVGIIWNY